MVVSADKIFPALLLENKSEQHLEQQYNKKSQCDEVMLLIKKNK